MDRISFVKNFRVGRNWSQEGITEQEEKSLQELIESKNEAVMQRAFKTAETILARYTSPYSNNLDAITAVACRIYESNRIHAQSLFESYITRKIYLLRNGNGNGNEQTPNGEEQYE